MLEKIDKERDAYEKKKKKKAKPSQKEDTPNELWKFKKKKSNIKDKETKYIKKKEVRETKFFVNTAHIVDPRYASEISVAKCSQNIK